MKGTWELTAPFSPLVISIHFQYFTTCENGDRENYFEMKFTNKKIDKDTHTYAHTPSDSDT